MNNKTIYINNSNGEEIPWHIESECRGMYEIFYNFVVTHIDKRYVYDVNDNGKQKLKYDKIIDLPENDDIEVSGIF